MYRCYFSTSLPLYASEVAGGGSKEVNTVEQIDM